jgi:hypothetical protein
LWETAPPHFLLPAQELGIKICVRTRAATLCLTVVFGVSAGERPGDWTGPYDACDGHAELSKPGHMSLGVRFATSKARVATAFARAMSFWADVLDMEWHTENGRECAIQVVDGHTELFASAQSARAQFPTARSFQGWIRHRTEPVEIVARGLGKLEEFAQQVFRTGKRDMQVARFQGHSRRQVGQFPGEYVGLHGDLHARRRLLPAQLIDGMAQTFSSLAFPLEFLTIGQAPQMLDQQSPVDQEAPASLETAEAVQQLDGTPAPQSAQTFDDGAIHYRHVERFQ